MGIKENAWLKFNLIFICMFSCVYNHLNLGITVGVFCLLVCFYFTLEWDLHIYMRSRSSSTDPVIVHHHIFHSNLTLALEKAFCIFAYNWRSPLFSDMLGKGVVRGRVFGWLQSTTSQLDTTKSYTAPLSSLTLIWFDLIDLFFNQTKLIAYPNLSSWYLLFISKPTPQHTL